MLVERKTTSKNRINRIYIKLVKQDLKSQLMEEELRAFKLGEPSEAFFPYVSFEADENVVFTAERKKTSKRHKPRERAATAEDIQNRQNEQLEKYVEYEHYAKHPGNLTMQWRRFGLRHRGEIEKLKG